jgi:hypothetical protein
MKTPHTKANEDGNGIESGISLGAAPSLIGARLRRTSMTAPSSYHGLRANLDEICEPVVPKGNCYENNSRTTAFPTPPKRPYVLPFPYATRGGGRRVLNESSRTC